MADFVGHPGRGPKASHALTFTPDHPMGAGQEGRIEEWIGERLAQHRAPYGQLIQQRGDGRWVLISERKTDDGGTVALYSDITVFKVGARTSPPKNP